MKTLSTDQFLQQIERNLRHGKTALVLEKYCEYFTQNPGYGHLLEIVRQNSSRLSIYQDKERRGEAVREAELHSILLAAWSVFEQLKDSVQYESQPSPYPTILPRRGRLTHHIPRQMEIGKVTECKIRIVFAPRVIREKESVATSNVIEETEIPILSTESEIQMISVDRNAFKVQLIPNIPVQRFLPICTEWTYFVTPKQLGDHILNLSLLSVQHEHGVTTKQLVFSVNPTIQVLEHPVAEPKGFAAEKTTFVVQIPLLKYIGRLIAVFLLTFWLPILLIMVTGTSIVVAVNEFSKDDPTNDPPPSPINTVVIKTDVVLTAPHFRQKSRAGEIDIWESPRAGDRFIVPAYKIREQDSVYVWDRNFLCSGQRDQSDIINCKCRSISPDILVEVKADSSMKTTETCFIKVDPDTTRYFGSRVGPGLYTVKYRFADFDRSYMTYFQSGELGCNEHWIPKTDPGKIKFDECAPRAMMYHLSSIRLLMDTDIKEPRLLYPDSNKCNIVRNNNERIFDFDYQHDSPDSPFLEVKVAARNLHSSNPCLCTATVKLVPGKITPASARCQEVTEFITLILKPEFELEDPEVSIDNHYWTRYKNRGGQLIIELPKGNRPRTIQVQDGEYKHIARDVVPNRAQTILLQTDKVKLTIQLDNIASELIGETYTIVDARKPSRELYTIKADAGRKDVPLMKINANKNLLVIWKTWGEGGHMATIKVGRIDVNDQEIKGGHYRKTCFSTTEFREAARSRLNR